MRDLGGGRHLFVRGSHTKREILVEPVSTELGMVGREDDEAAAIDHSEDFLDRAPRMVHVMDREGSYRAVEASIGKRQRLGISLNPSDASALEARLRDHGRG